MRKLLFLSGFLIVFAACKKYPDGGYLKQSQKHILGKWKLDLYEVNGIDSTNLIDFNGSGGYKNASISKLKTTFSSYNLRIDNSISIPFNFSDNNKSLYIFSSMGGKACLSYPDTNTCYRIIYSPENGNVTWTIAKLTKNELVLEANFINKYVIILKK